MPFVDFPQSEFSANKEKVRKMSKPKRVLRNLRRATRTSTTLLPIDRTFAGTKLTKTQSKNVNKHRAIIGKKNKKMVKQIWRKLF
jgi:hypothetical protein